jgi:hypothetical protein
MVRNALSSPPCLTNGKRRQIMNTALAQQPRLNLAGKLVSELPDRLVWSKTGFEAGLSLDQIIRWKELQRQAGKGSFYWGVGNKPSDANLSLLSQYSPSIPILFSKQKNQSASPNERPIDLWTHFINGKQERPLPDGVAITSAAMKSGKPKPCHYALVCHSDDRLEIRRGIGFDVGEYRNLTGGTPIGNSQVTSAIERRPAGMHCRLYNEGFWATLRKPYAVKLTQPIRLTGAQVEEQRQMLQSTVTIVSDLMNFLTRIRR